MAFCERFPVFAFGSAEGNKVWTGYYTSRPAIKYAARVANSILQAVKQMIVTAAVRGG